MQHVTRISHLEPHRVGWPRAVIHREMGKRGLCRLKKMYNVRVASRFIWGKMRTAAQEIALRNCFKEGGEASIYVILVKGEYIHSNTLFFQVSASFVKRLLVTRNRYHHEGF